MNFIYSCLNCNSHFIRAIVLHGINVSRINSPIGRNAVFCSLLYNICVDQLYDTKLSSNYFFARFKSELPTDLLARANVLREAILIRDGIFALPNVEAPEPWGQLPPLPWLHGGSAGAEKCPAPASALAFPCPCR